MPRLIHLFLFALLLALLCSCAAPALTATPALPAPVPQAQVSGGERPTLTATFTPLLPTPSKTPTATATATPTEPPTPEATTIPFESGPSLEFSPLFPAEWHNEWAGNVTLSDGSTLNIPVIVGLASDVIHNPDGSILGVWMKQQGADAWADAFLRAAHYRYTTIMGNNITYEQYLELLKQPTGGEISLGILDNDGKTMRMAMIDPRQGFSMLIANKQKMPVRTLGELGDFFGVDGKGRLLYANNFGSEYPVNFRLEKMFGVPVQGYSFLRTNFSGMTYFGILDNKCLLAKACSTRNLDGDLLVSWLQTMDSITNKQVQDQKLDLIFGLVTP